MPLDSKQLKPFFAKFGRFVALTTHSGDWISRFGNFSVHDDNDDDDRIDCSTPCTCTWDNYCERKDGSGQLHILGSVSLNHK